MKKQGLLDRLEVILTMAIDCIGELRKSAWEPDFNDFPFDLESERRRLSNMELLNALLHRFEQTCERLAKMEFSNQERIAISEKIHELVRKFPNRIRDKFSESLSDTIFRPNVGDWVRVSRGFYREKSGKVINVDLETRKFTAEFLTADTVHDSPYQTRHYLQERTLSFSSIEKIILDSIEEYEEMLERYRVEYISST